jgi:hypothetical protein
MTGFYINLLRTLNTSATFALQQIYMFAAVAELTSTLPNYAHSCPANQAKSVSSGRIRYQLRHAYWIPKIMTAGINAHGNNLIKLS